MTASPFGAPGAGGPGRVQIALTDQEHGSMILALDEYGGTARRAYRLLLANAGYPAAE